MHGRIGSGRGRLRLGMMAAALAALALGGCSSGLVGGSSAPASTGSTGGTGFRERMTSLFSSSTPQPAAATDAQAATPNIDPAENCPGVDIRQGASTLQFLAPSRDP